MQADATKEEVMEAIRDVFIISLNCYNSLSPTFCDCNRSKNQKIIKNLLLDISFFALFKLRNAET
jgi:hypothetical protein